ncbi:MAG: AAA family ATPase [Pseudomonadales bacterium]
MYLDYFGLSTPPFGITPDTSLFFDGAERGHILEAMLYALDTGGGIIKVVGEVGSGKTMLSRMLSKRVPENVVSVFLLNPSIKAEQVLYAIAYDLGIEVESDTPTVRTLHLLQEKLLALYQQGKKVVLIIDEAQQMPLDTLEEIRLLSNLETETEKLLQIILFGQPELDEHLDTVNIRQLRERIAYSFYLTPLTGQTTEQYLSFRLEKSGHQGRVIFKPSAIKLLTRYSGGTLRRLNLLADKSLLAAYLDKKPVVETRHVRTALKDNTKGQSRQWRSIGISATVVCLIGIAAVTWLIQPGINASQPALVSTALTTSSANTETPAIEARPTASADLDLLEKRIAAYPQWQAKHNSDYTIRLLSAAGSGSKTVERFLQTISKTSDINQSYVTTLNTENNDYVVYYGNFQGYSDALKALQELPEPLRRFAPYISSIPK